MSQTAASHRGSFELGFMAKLIISRQLIFSIGSLGKLNRQQQSHEGYQGTGQHLSMVHTCSWCFEVAMVVSVQPEIPFEIVIVFHHTHWALISLKTGFSFHLSAA